MDRASLAALRRVWDVPAAVALAFCAALLVILGLVPTARVMPLLLERKLEVQQHLASGAGPTGGVAVLGSSVVLEGVDCAALAVRLPAGVPCENLGWTGANPRQWLLVEPALRRSPPRVIVLGLDLLALLHPDAIPTNLLAIAGWWDFVPASERAALHGVLGADELRVLAAPRAAQLLRFRSFPLDAFNERMREVARSDLRFEGYATNFTDPWIIRGPLAPVAIERHLVRTSGQLRAGRLQRLPDTEPVLTLLVEKSRSAAPEVRFLFVLTPLHPQLGDISGPLLDAARRSLGALARQLDVDFVDDSLALPAELFADALHPSAAGRAAWSARLGAATAARLAP
jgi:hypothetical protein